MNDCEKLVEDLRDIEKTMFALGTSQINIDKISMHYAYDKRWGRTAADAADAIEALQAEVKILKVSGREAYFEGLAADANGRQVEKLAKRNAELHAELEKWVSAAEKAGDSMRSEWVRVEDEESYHYECSRCGERPLYSRFGDVVLSGVCPMCGAKMEVQE